MGLFKKSLTNLSSFLAILETSDADMFFNPNFENTFSTFLVDTPSK